MGSNSKDEVYFRKMIDSEKYIILGKMSSSIAHEINNPVMIIQNLVALIIDEIDKEGKINCQPSSENYENLKEIINECKRISNITKSLQDFSRTSSKKHQERELETVILNVVNFMQHLFVKNQVQVKINAEAVRTKCLIRYDQIQQVFVNLLDNSLSSLYKKYGTKKTPREKKFIDITFKTKSIGKGKNKIDYAVVEFYDDGVGIPEEARKHIFEPFFTTKKTKEDYSDEFHKNQGLGLGLSISQVIIEDHNGFIEFDSKEDEYARFSIYLPIFSDKFKNQDDLEEEIVF